jgi:methionyl-tRNA formyltransferase
MTILFIGTGEIGVPTLRWLVDHSGHRVTGVVCQPDKPAGRRQTLTPPATKALALEAGLPVFQPERINDPAALASLLTPPPDLIVVMAYGQFLPRRLREGARLGCINLHASLLPRWRGASPIQSALAAGDPESGITVMHVVREMDAGDTILSESTPIAADDTGQSLHDRLAHIAPQALARALPLLENGTAPRLPQPPDQVTRCAKLNRAAARLDWSQPAIELERLIRAFHPWPGTHTFLPANHGNRLLKIFPPARIVPLPVHSVAPDPPSAPRPGQIVAVNRDSIVVATGEDALAVTSLQAEGQKRLSARDFLAGTRLETGQVLGEITGT